MTVLPDFDSPDLAKAVDQLTHVDIDASPYGVIALDAAGLVRICNRTGVEATGRATDPASRRDFFSEIAPRMNAPYFKGKIDMARVAGTLGLTFTYFGDYTDNGREPTVRVQSARDGGVWIFQKRGQ
jgi:photoactive yellow protein